MHRQEARGLIAAAIVCGLLCSACGFVQQTKPDGYIYAVLTDPPASTAQTQEPPSEPERTETEPTEQSETEPETNAPETEPETETESETTETEPETTAPTGGIRLEKTSKGHYNFVYDGMEFEAVHKKDHWKIMDSWRITDTAAMIKICQALIDLYPIHGADYESYRTPDDMAYEWAQHNLAYALLPDDSEWKSHARDVDLDPDDQGRSMYEIFLDRTGG